MEYCCGAMTRIVTSTYRYKPPPKRKRRKLAEITGPAVVTSVDPKKLRRPATRRKATPQPANDDGQPATSSHHGTKSAIVTARKVRSRRSDVPDMTPEEHKRRGDAADAMFREMKRQIATALRKP